MPGIINSFDPATQTAVIQPALRRRVKGEAVSLPLLYDVPVFFPGSRVSGITWPVAAGDECLVVFADASIDTRNGFIRSRWYYKGDTVYNEFEIPQEVTERLTLPSGRKETLTGGVYCFAE